MIATAMTQDEKHSAEKRYRSFLGGEGFSAGDLERLIQRYREKQAESIPQGGLDVQSSGMSVDQILDVLKSLPPIHESLSIPKAQVEGIYNIGYQNYNQGQYDKSTQYFRLAYILDPVNEKYLFSLGLSLEKERQYFEAASAYLLWSQMQTDSPLGDFRAAVCFMELGDLRAAEGIFKAAAGKCGTESRFEPVLQRTQLYLEGLKTQKNPG